MAEQDDATTMGNIQLAIQAALMRARTATVGKVLAYRELPPNGAPVVDVQVSPLMLARPVNGQASEATEVAPKRNIPVAFFQCGDFTVKTQVRPGQHVLLIVCDRDIDSWMRGDGETYRPAIPGVVHDINDAIAFPFLTPEAFQPGVRPTAAELFIGDRTGQVCSIVMNSKTGDVTVKGATTVNVEAPAVTLGSTGIAAPIARTGIDFVVVPAGGAGGTFPIVPGPIPGGPASAHKVLG